MKITRMITNKSKEGLMVQLIYIMIGDFVIEDKIVVELKTTTNFHPQDFRAYLKSVNLRLGILVNFKDN